MDLMEIIAAERDNMVPWKMLSPIHHKSPNLEIRLINEFKKNFCSFRLRNILHICVFLNIKSGDILYER